MALTQAMVQAVRDSECTEARAIRAMACIQGWVIQVMEAQATRVMACLEDSAATQAEAIRATECIMIMMDITSITLMDITDTIRMEITAIMRTEIMGIMMVTTGTITTKWGTGEKTAINKKRGERTLLLIKGVFFFFFFLTVQSGKGNIILQEVIFVWVGIKNSIPRLFCAER